MNDPHTLLKTHNLRATTPRLLVVEALAASKGPLNQKEIHDRLQEEMNLVTVYRILEALAQAGLTHRHLSSGGYILCSHTKQKGHHVLLSCEGCGAVEECIDQEFCAHEDRIATKNGFIPKAHLSELIGVCSSCS